jgi:hypothetical protein
MKKRLTLAACALAASIGSAVAEDFSGCMKVGASPCPILQTKKGNYALLVNPFNVPPSGRGITVKGTVFNGPNTCMMNPVILVSEWSFNRLRCPRR